MREDALWKKLNKYLQSHKELSRRNLLRMCDEGYFGRKFEYSTAEKKLRDKTLCPNVVALDQFGEETSQFNCNPIIKYVWVGAELPPDQRPVKRYFFDKNKNTMIAYI